MKQLRLPWQHIPDDQFITNIRKSIRFLDRFRMYWILFNVGFLVLACWTFAEAFRLVVGFGGGNPNPAILGFSTGATIGLSASCIIHQILHNLIYAFANARSERLLLRYYDAFKDDQSNEYEVHDHDES